MQRMFTTAALASAMAVGFVGNAQADTEVEQLRAEMAQMRAELAQMKAQQEGDWLTQARADEVRALIGEVLADAETRAALMQEGQMLGIDSKGKMMLSSPDGDFTMNIGGQIQFRYIWNNYENARTDESISGFQMRRTKVKVAGDVADNWEYTLVLATDRDGGEVFMEDAIITLDATENLDVHFGVMKLPFARQELISSTRLVAVERGFATEFFTLNRGEGVNFAYEQDKVRAWAMLSDGANNSYLDFNNTGAPEAHDFAVTGRVDVMVMGDDWDASKHAFGAEDQALFVGGAINYAQADGGALEDQFTYTVDALYKGGNFGVMAGVFGSHADAAVNTDAFGLFGQVDYKIADTKWDIFARYDHIDDDTGDKFDAFTVGANYNVNKNVKVTGDLVFIPDSDNPDAVGFLNGGEASDGVGVTGLADDSGEDMIVLRLQLQLLF